MSELALHVFTVNGRHMASEAVGERLFALTISQDGEFVLMGGEGRSLTVRYLHNLSLAFRFKPMESAVRSIITTSTEQHILVGLASGKLVVYSLDTMFLRKLFIKRLAYLGF
jgi:hypothetical protein